MNHLTWGDPSTTGYPVAFLVPQLRKDDIERVYLNPYGLDPASVMCLSLHYSKEKKKTPMAEMREYVTTVLAPVLNDQHVQYVMCADADYFKALTKLPKAEPYAGYACDTEYGSWKIFYIPNYQAMFYDPVKVTQKVKQAMEGLESYASGAYTDPGVSIIHYAEYPKTTEEIRVWLGKLLQMESPLTIDIEGFDLKHTKCGIGTISFAWNQNEGIAFPVDYQEIPGATEAPFGLNVRNEEVREMLKAFFIAYQQKSIYHNIAFDAYVLVYQLFMKDILDTEGLLEGMSIMLKNWDCTKLISYLATNSCAGNKLGLKDQAQEFAGNYAVEEIKDITRIPLPKLLEYNLVDSLSTWFVHNKRNPQMIQDNQLPIYHDLFKPATEDVVQMQLTGMPVNMKRVKEVKVLLQADNDKALNSIHTNPIVQKYVYTMNERWVHMKNTTLVKKRVTIADAKEVFNPNSDPQLQDLLFKIIGLPVIAITKNRQPSTAGDTLKALRNHTADPLVKSLLNALMDFKAVDKILTSFIGALEKAELGPDGWHYLFGNFNLGGTVSGRLSSSKPNLQNLPASSKYAKLIKSCFQAPPNWLFMGLDFASLEDRISALTTKDPNKLKVYTDGYDGHCLRAFAYWPDQMPDIINTVESINSIAKKYKHLRQDSKEPTFALTYQGTWKTLMVNQGWTKEKSMEVEAKYHELYVESDKWIASKLDQACKDGYVTVAFGLRVRTPLLAQVIRGSRSTPAAAEGEGRTAGNALGQSWCLLNSRASKELMAKVRAHPEMRLKIRPCAHIHDAQYWLVSDEIHVIQWLNHHVVEAVNWQDHPDIEHPDVGLGGELSVFWPSWAHEAVIPNDATEEEIFAVVSDHLDGLNAA